MLQIRVAVGWGRGWCVEHEACTVLPLHSFTSTLKLSKYACLHTHVGLRVHSQQWRRNMLGSQVYTHMFTNIRGCSWERSVVRFYLSIESSIHISIDLFTRPFDNRHIHPPIHASAYSSIHSYNCRPIDPFLHSPRDPASTCLFHSFHPWFIHPLIQPLSHSSIDPSISLSILLLPHRRRRRRHLHHLVVVSHPGSSRSKPGSGTKGQWVLDPFICYHASWQKGSASVRSPQTFISQRAGIKGKSKSHDEFRHRCFESCPSKILGSKAIVYLQSYLKHRSEQFSQAVTVVTFLNCITEDLLVSCVDRHTIFRDRAQW